MRCMIPSHGTDRGWKWCDIVQFTIGMYIGISRYKWIDVNREMYVTGGKEVDIIGGVVGCRAGSFFPINFIYIFNYLFFFSE